MRIHYFNDLPYETTTSKINAVMSMLNCDIKTLPYLLGQISVESSGFSTMRENMNYSKVETIAKIFPRLLKTNADLSCFVKNPTKLGNACYGKYEYRGYGGIQLTGLDNQNKFFEANNRPHGDYKDYNSPISERLSDFYLTSGFYYNMMRDKIIITPDIKTNALLFSRLVNRGVNSKPSAKPLHAEERYEQTLNWIKIVNKYFGRV
jgi:hypothetical protein